MLGKLIKYEFKATGRTMWPVCGVFMLIAIVNSIFFATQANTLGAKADMVTSNSFIDILFAVLIFAYVIGMLALIVITYVVLINRFYKNDLSNEGYLTHTLPVTANEELMSKTIIGTFWMIMSSLVVFASVLVILVPLLTVSGEWGLVTANLGQAWSRVLAYYGGNVPVIIIEGLIAFIISTANSVLAMYVALALGHTFKKNKVLAAFGMYVLINIIETMVISIIGAVSVPLFAGVLEAMTPVNVAHLLMIGTTLFTIVTTLIYYLITHHVLDTKLNLE